MIESRIVDTILDGKKEVELGGVTYEVAPLSMRTLYKLSALVSELPVIDVADEDFITLVIRHAKDCTILDDIAALLIVGYDGMKKRRIFGKTLFRKVRDKVGSERPKKIEKILASILQDSDIESFFRITTSLKDANILTPTGEVVPPGQ